MVQRVEAWGNVLEFPDGMSDEDMASAILENEVHLNPNASTSTKAKSIVSNAVDAGLSLFTPKKSIADQAQERSASTAGLAAPQVQGVPVRQDFYNRMVAETPAGSTTSDTGIVARTRNAAAQDTQAQKAKRVVGKALVSNEPVPEEGGFINSAGRTIGQNIKGAGQIAADFIPGVEQDNAVKRYGQAVIDANPTAVNSLEDIADKPGTAVAEATGNAAPSMAGMVGARVVGQGITALSPLAGPAAPLVAAAGQVVSWLGPAAIASLPSYSGIRDKQILNDPKNQESARAKAIALLGAGAVGAIEQAFGPQQWALAALTKEGRASLAEKFAATTLPGAIGKGIAKGAAIEGSEELAQNPIEQLASFDNPATTENLKETAFGGAMGAIGGGVLGGGTGVLARQSPTPTILGRPITEISNGVLNYTAARGSNRAKAAAQAELARRAAQGVDPAVANQPESTSEAVERIISTGRDKAQEIKDNAPSEPDAIQSGIFDEPDHIVDATNMVDEGTGGAVTDNPTPEPVETLNAQLNALAEGRKPGVLLTPGEPLPAALPPDVKVAMVPNRGMLLYRDDATLQAALNGQMGAALGYGIDEKPRSATQVVTARDPNGTVIQDVATDGNPQVQQAAAAVAGPGGSAEVRPVQEAMAERGDNYLDSDAAKFLKQFGYSTKELAEMSPARLRDTRAAMSIIQQDHQYRGIQNSGADWAERMDYAREIENDIKNGRVQLPQGGLKVPVQNRSSAGYAHGRLEEAEKEVLEWAEGNRQKAIDALKQEIDDGHYVDEGGIYNLDLLDFMNRKTANPGKSKAISSPSKDKSPGAQSPAGTESAPKEAPAVHPIRPLVESLIKRRAAAKESGKERSLNSAITRAKEVMDGKRTDTELESKWFRVQAAGMKKADPDTAEILKRIGEAVKSGKLELPNIAEKDYGSTGTTDGISQRGNERTKELSGRESKARVDAVENRGNALAGGIPGGSERVLANDGQRRTEVEGNETAKFSRSPSNEDIEFAHEFLTELSGVDELFRHTLSHKTSLQGVMKEVYPGTEYVGDGTRADERDESGADHRYVFKSPHGKQFYVYERDNGEVFIDVSHFSKGEGGQDVYAAVANWAYNTKRKFIGDPAGLTADSLIRRTSNMLSAALRYGTVKHLEAAPQQIAGDPKNGVPPLDWSGDDVAKIRALIHTFITTLHNQLPAIKNARYDFSRGEFLNRLGMPLDRAAFQRIASSGVGQAARAGEATMRRGILIQSLISSSSGARPGILEQVLHGSRAFVLRGKLEGIFSRKKESDRIASVRQRLKAAEDRAKQATHSGGLSVSGDRKASVQSLVDSIRSEWKNAPEIVVVSDMSDSAIPERVRNENDRQMSQGAVGQPEGFFYKGKVYIVASEMRSPDDVVRVLFHETLGHFGLRGVFGEELKPILKQVAVGWRSKVEAKAEQYGLDMSVEKDRLMAAEEVLAELAQTNPQIGMVQRAIAIIRAWLRKNVPALANMKMTDAEIIHRFLIPARRFVQEGRVTTQEGLAPAFSRQTETQAFKKWFGDSKVVDKDGKPLVVYHGTNADFPEFQKGENRMSMRAEAGYWFSTSPDEASTYGSAVMPVYLNLQNPKRITQRQLDFIAHERPIKETIKQWRRQGHDGLIIEPIPEDRALDQKAQAKQFVTFDNTQIKSATGNNGEFDSSNPDIRFSRSTPGNNASWDAPEPSMMDDLIYKLQNKHIDLKRVVEAVKATGAQIADKWNAYLQEELFHGRAAKRVQDFVNDELRPIIQGMKLRGLTVDELDQYLHARHAEEANKLIAQRDPNMPDGGSGMTTKDARAYLAGLPADQKQRLENVAKMVDAVIAKTRDLYLSYGLIDQATANSWKNMFQHYVPLMREDQDGGMGIGQGFSIKGKEVKHRTGSRRKVVDILANIALQREKAIVRGEKNRVAVSLVGLAKLNPNPDFWTFDKVPTEKVLNEVTNQVEERPVPNFKSQDNVVVAKIKDSKGNVIERAVIFNEHDERAMRMAQALKNLDADQLGGLLGVSAAITRYFAAINTQFNPVFGVVNLTRDLQASLLNLSSTPIAGHKAEVLKNVLPAIRAIYSASRGDRKGKQATSPMAALWDEMQQEGGMTGYRDLFRTSEDRANAIKRELDPTAWMNNPLGKVFTAGGMLKVPLAVAQQKAKWIFDWLSDYNQTLEGAMRLSVYKTAIDNGISKQRAASIAKNISVNFNRKGQSGQQAGALYAFFNAAMQGTARIGETMFDMDKGDIKTLRLNRAGKTIMVGGITLGAMQALALAAAGFDDDEPPEFVRERSLIIPIGDKKYVTIPMPLGFHAIPNIGRLSTEFAMGGFKKPANYTIKLFSVFAEAFNPIGNAGMSIQTIAPTAIDPLVALAENRDWTGKPIAKEDFNTLSPTPGFSRNKDTASLPSKWIAEAINTISGGNKYVPGVFSPTADQIDYLAGQLTGGVGREAGKTQQTISATLSGEDLPPHKVPLIGRFYGSSESQSSQGNAFYSNLRRINEIEAELKGRRKDGLPLDEFKAEHPEYQLVARANLVERIVSKQRKIKSELIAKDAPRTEVKAVEERITNLMAGFNKNVKELQQRPQAAH